MSDGPHIEGQARLAQGAPAGRSSSSAPGNGWCVSAAAFSGRWRNVLEVEEQSKLPLQAGLAAADLLLLEVVNLCDTHLIYHETEPCHS